MITETTRRRIGEMRHHAKDAADMMSEGSTHTAAHCVYLAVDSARDAMQEQLHEQGDADQALHTAGHLARLLTSIVGDNRISKSQDEDRARRAGT